MEKLLLIRARIKELYAQWDIYINPAVKFLTALSVMAVFDNMVGYRAILSRWTVMVLIALVCSLLPWRGITAVTALYAVLHLSALSWEVAAEACVFLVLMMILHFLFLPGCSIVIVLVPLAYVLRIPYLIPIVVGLMGTTASFIPVGLGVFWYYFLLCVQRNANVLMEGAVDSDILSRLTVVLEALRVNRLMLLSILAFCVVTILVHCLKRMSVDYAPIIAITAGGIVNMLIFLLGGFMLNVTVPYVDVILGTLLSLALAAAIQFIILAVDYSRTEFLQYEDDEYVYYVKAVPKINLTAQKRRVKEINAHSTEEEDEKDIERAIDILASLDKEETAQLRKTESKESPIADNEVTETNR